MVYPSSILGAQQRESVWYCLVKNGTEKSSKDFIMEEKIIEVGSDGWTSLMGEIASTYGDGNLIKHEWLKEKFGLKGLVLNDFETVSDFLKAIEIQQFAYMSLVDKLRWDLLKDFKMYIKNQRGEGYIILRPEDQTQYGYDSFVDDIKKAIRVANLIMNNVQPVDMTQQAKDNDLRAKFGVMRQMLGSIKTNI